MTDTLNSDCWWQTVHHWSLPLSLFLSLSPLYGFLHLGAHALSDILVLAAALWSVCDCPQAFAVTGVAVSFLCSLSHVGCSDMCSPATEVYVFVFLHVCVWQRERERTLLWRPFFVFIHSYEQSAALVTFPLLYFYYSEVQRLQKSFVSCRWRQWLQRTQQEENGREQGACEHWHAALQSWEEVSDLWNEERLPGDGITWNRK